MPGVDFYDKLRILATAGDLPDLWYTETKQVLDAISRNMLLDITELFNTESGLTEATTGPNEWKKNWFQGKMYHMVSDIYPGSLYYNKDIFDKKGIPYPPKNWDDPDWTYDKLLETALTLTEGEGTSRSWGIDDNPWWVWCQPIIWSFGGLVTNEDRTASAMTMPETIDAFRWRAACVTEQMWRRLPAQAPEGTQTLFTSGRLAMVATWSPWMFYINNVPDLHFDFGAQPRAQQAPSTGHPQMDSSSEQRPSIPKRRSAMSRTLRVPSGQEQYDNIYGNGVPSLRKVAELDNFVHPVARGSSI